MKDLKNLLPSNKFDVEQAKKLKDLDRSQVLLLLPDLIGYTQDINCPLNGAQFILAPSQLFYGTSDNLHVKFTILEYFYRKFSFRCLSHEDFIGMGDSFLAHGFDKRLYG